MDESRTYFESLIDAIVSDWVATTCMNRTGYANAYAESLSQILKEHGIPKANFITVALENMAEKGRTAPEPIATPIIKTTSKPSRSQKRTAKPVQDLFL